MRRTITVDSFSSCIHNRPPVGAKIKFRSEKQRYTVQAANTAYAICTKPFNARRTYLYTIVDQLRHVRGPANYLFGLEVAVDNPEGAAALLQLLTEGRVEVSHRRDLPLDIESITFQHEAGDA